MSTTMQYDFIADKEKNTLTIRREFSAPRQLVWDCYTKSEYLDQWFAPKPLTAKTKSMDFSVGGHWHYAMIDLDGTEYWGYTEYTEISPIDFYKTLDAFSNAEGKINNELPGATWKVSFNENGNNTIVESFVQYNSLEELETVINMGMKDGMESTLLRLDELIEKLNN